MTTAAAVLIFVGIAILIGAIIAGAATFSPSLAAAVKLAEDDLPLDVEHKIRLRHPEIVKADRLDRHDAYVWLHIGLWFVGWGFALAPGPNSALASLSWDAQKLLGLCLVNGSTVALVGIALGLSLPGGRRILRRVADNAFSDLLGDDIRIPYAFATLGLLSVGVSMCSYAWTIWQFGTLIGTLAGGLTFAIAGMCVTLGWKFIRRMRIYGQHRDVVVAEIRREDES
jgi:hypothetical protein